MSNNAGQEPQWFRFAVAIPLLATLVMVNRQEAFRRRAASSMLVTIAQVVGQLCAFVGLVAGFWHIFWVAGAAVVVTGLPAVGVHSAGYMRLEQGRGPAATYAGQRHPGA